MDSYEETYDNLRLADIAGDIIRDLACQTNEREFTKDGKSFDADWYLRWSQEDTVDWSEVEPLLDSPNDIMVRFELIRQRYNRVDGTTHSWLECKIVGRPSSNTTIEKTAPPAATWANLVRGKTTKAKLQQQQESYGQHSESVKLRQLDQVERGNSYPALGHNQRVQTKCDSGKLCQLDYVERGNSYPV